MAVWTAARWSSNFSGVRWMALSVSDVARYCGVPTEEVVRWIDTGRLVATYLDHGGFRIAVGDFMAFFSRYAFLI